MMIPSLPPLETLSR